MSSSASPRDPQPPFKKLCSLLTSFGHEKRSPSQLRSPPRAREAGGNPITGRNLQRGLKQHVVLQTRGGFSFQHGLAQGYKVLVLPIGDSGRRRPRSPPEHAAPSPPIRPSPPTYQTTALSKRRPRPLPRREMTSCSGKQGERGFFFSSSGKRGSALAARLPGERDPTVGGLLQVQKLRLLWYEEVSRDSVDITSDQAAGTNSPWKEAAWGFLKVFAVIAQCK